jgi:CDP-glucose 4,6-dehydratase
MSPNHAYWRGRRVFLTGHSGFKGAWLALWLHRMGAQVTGYALPPATTPNLHDLLGIGQRIQGIFADVRDASALQRALAESKAEVVLHLAAQAFVRESYLKPLETFETNIGGTANMLEAMRGTSSVKAAVIVTTDKVYRNSESGVAFAEEDELGGHDPYSASKAAAELVTASYRESCLAGQGIAVASARAGNVIGGGDWSPERLIPDCMRAWGQGKSVDIRMPGAVRPWQHVLEPLAAYLILAERIWQEPGLAGPFNFGPDPAGSASVRDAVSLAQAHWGSSAHANFANSNPGPKEAISLRLNSAKARKLLGVAPKWDLAETIGRTVDWYRKFAGGLDAEGLCTADIAAFEGP